MPPLDKTLYALLPLSIPADSVSIRRLHYQVYLNSPEHHNSGAPLQTLEDFTTTGIPQVTASASKPGALGFKIVLRDAPPEQQLVSYIVFNPPRPHDTRTDAQRAQDLRQAIEGSSSGLDKEHIFNLKTQDRLLNLQFLGQGSESKYWDLDQLVTDEAHQRRGLGSWLVSHGLRVVERRVREEGTGGIAGTAEGNERIEGVYCVANPEGWRTYAGCGMTKIGERSVGEAEGGDPAGADGKDGETAEPERGRQRSEHGWFLKKFEAK